MVCAAGESGRALVLPHHPPRLRHAHAARRGRRAVDPADARPRPAFHDGDLYDGANHRLEGGARTLPSTRRKSE
jgi:hypothetical protein